MASGWMIGSMLMLKDDSISSVLIVRYEVNVLTKTRFVCHVTIPISPKERKRLHACGLKAYPRNK